MLRLTFLSLAFFASACMVNAQEAQSQSKLAPASVTLTADGELVGNAIASIDGDEQPVEAKITISKDGVVVDSIYANEDGSFAFPSVAPGVYNMYGAAANYAGAATVTVLPSSAAVSTPMTLGLSTAPIAAAAGYAGFAQASCSACAPAPVASSCGCNSHGGGGLGRGGFGGGLAGGGFNGGLAGSGLGGGGLLGGGGGLWGSNAFRFAAVGGIVAAIAIDDDDDASPTN